MTEVKTIHRKIDGEQVTFRKAILTDATGRTTSYLFRVLDHGHRYVGEGDPSQKAREAVAEYRR